ncbi:MAG: Hsp20/alpha crystallin family protein [Clostridia bacterium]|nr:Hsp20/alpha crystallin family protein [Clostridia bacterium]
MYLMPYGGDLFDELKSPFDDFFKKFDVRPEFKNVMSTDIVEKDDGLEMIVDLPGVKKEDIKIELNKGYLIITASSNVEKEEKDDSKNYLRRERSTGRYRRSFFVGEELTEEDIKAKFENGTLTINLPKKEQKKIEEKKTINIE